MDYIYIVYFMELGVAEMIAAIFLAILAIVFILWACFGSKRGMDDE